MPYKVGLIVGSLRKGAYTRMLGEATKELAPPSWTLIDIGIGDLPLYNMDLETDTPPPAWTAFRKAVAASDGVLFITPEFNRGMPGALKNALDVGSRPWGHSVWNGKPTAVMSLTPGPLGAMAAHQQLRHTLSILNSPTLPGPEVYMPGAATLFDEAGKLKNEETKKIVTTLLQAFDKWIGRFKD
ncbi:MAG TPA: NAD(P)H-dependent oxidoreductase [Steroidobacteraceae bacterium]|nr:NAD(P)H-dependent oxidoreductase [Steroidobacteraceae bacterium]